MSTTLFFRGDHTESVQIDYDPKVTSYDKLLKLFWNNHDSTACHTRQYMSAIFYHNEEQKEAAKLSMMLKSKTYNSVIFHCQTHWLHNLYNMTKEGKYNTNRCTPSCVALKFLSIHSYNKLSMHWYMMAVTKQ